MCVYAYIRIYVHIHTNMYIYLAELLLFCVVAISGDFPIILHIIELRFWLDSKLTYLCMVIS